MKIITAGGGSGGHVTPVLAVINELSVLQPELSVRFVCDKGFLKQAEQIMSQAAVPVTVQKIAAGKWRRYHGIPFFKQFFYWPTLSGNVKDLFLFGYGFLQSLLILIIHRPDVVFTKGGFVCVPVGLAAALLRIPLVIHDSDAHPGLTNRILARYARFIATGAPLRFYNYPPERASYVGIPVSSAYKPTTELERRKLKQHLNLEPGVPLLLVTGGGTGAQPINNALAAAYTTITTAAQVVHLTGAGKAEALRQKTHTDARYHIYEFVDQTTMALLVNAADVVISRAGANTLLELAAAGKPTIIVPNPRLTNGHQLKNAAVYKDANAAIIVDDETLQTEPYKLVNAALELLSDQAKRQNLSHAIHECAKPMAAKEVAMLLLKAVNTS